MTPKFAIRARRRMSPWQMLAFASIGLPIHAVTLAATVYLPHYYATQFGIGLAVVGSAFFIVRAIDIPIETLIGWAMDRTKTRFGRYRPWVVIGLPPFMLGSIFAFMPPLGVGRTYIVVWMLVLYLGHSIMTLSQLAWGSNLAPGYNDRSRLFGVIAAVGILGGASVITIPIIGRAMSVPESANVPTMGWLVTIAAPIMLTLMLWRTPKERVAPSVPGSALGYRDYLAIFRRPTFARVFIADLSIALGVSWVGAIYLFFFTDSRGFTTAQASALLAVYILSGVLGAPAMGRLAIRISKHRALLLACLVYAASTGSFLLLPRGNLVAHAVVLFIAGFMGASFTSLTRAMTADIADEIRLDQGQERAGLLYALTTMTNKVAAALSVALTFFALSKVGYIAEKGVANTPQAIRGLEIVYLCGPVLFVTIGALCVIGYDLDARRHTDIRRRLDERDAELAAAEGCRDLI